MFGELNIVASQELGELGAKEGNSVVYDWKWHYNVAGLGLWIVLVLALVLVRENRQWPVLAVLLPLGFLNLAWSVFVKSIGVGSQQVGLFDGMFMSAIIGMAVLWLLAHKIGRRNRILSFVLSIVVMSLVGFAGVLSYCGLSFSQNLAGFVIILSMVVISLLMSLFVAGWMCRKRFSGVRLCLWLCVWTVVVSNVTVLAFAVVSFMASGSSISFWNFIGQFVVVTLVLGVCVYVMNMAFVILGLVSGFYRERLYCLLSLQPAVAKEVMPWEPDAGGGPEGGDMVEN